MRGARNDETCALYPRCGGLGGIPAQFGAPFVEPLLCGAPIAVASAAYGTLIALALFALATMLDIESET